MTAQKSIPIATLKDRLHEAMTLRGKKAVDLATNLDIPKSAISQYLSGDVKKMSSPRLYVVSLYLDVSEAWLMGYDVPMERPADQTEEIVVKTTKEDSDTIIDATARMKQDDEFLSVVKKLNNLNDKDFAKAVKVLHAFFE